MSQEIKPCPFCGVIPPPPFSADAKSFFIQCTPKTLHGVFFSAGTRE